MFRNLATLLRSIHLVDFDPTSRSIKTDRGELRVNLKGVDNSTAYSLYHVSDTRCFAAMAQTSATWSGNQWVLGPSGGYVYSFSEGADDLAAARTIFAKSEMPGKLVIHGRSERPRSVSLVDVSPLGNTVLERLAWSPAGKGIEVTLGPTLQSYWVQADW